MDLELTYIKNPDGSRRLTIPEDRKALAVAFLRDGGLKSPSEMESLVQDGHVAVLRAIDGMSDVQAAYKPEPDEWSVLEVMAHVVTCKQIVALLAPSLAAGTLPPGFGAPLEQASAQDGVTVSRFETLDAARAAADVAHTTLIDFIRAADDSANTDTTFTHFVFGALNAREWAVFQRLHDDDHRPQIDAIHATAGFPGR